MKKSGTAALAVFFLTLTTATWAVTVAPQQALPSGASRFLAVLETREVGGEKVGLWDRLAAGFVLANEPARCGSRS